MGILPEILTSMKKKTIWLVLATIASFLFFSLIFSNWELIKGWFI
jgi:hypothetical protein